MDSNNLAPEVVDDMESGRRTAHISIIPHSIPMASTASVPEPSEDRIGLGANAIAVTDSAFLPILKDGSNLR